MRNAFVDRRALTQALCLTASVALTPSTWNGANAISATTMTGKSKPDLNIVLLDKPSQANDGTVSAEVVLAGGSVAQLAFQSKWSLADGGYYDVEANDRDGDAAYLQLIAPPKGAALGTLPATALTSSILGVDGRFGAYGAPNSIKVLSDTTVGATRRLDLSFVALSPQSEFPRRVTVAALQPQAGGDVVCLVSGGSEKRWRKSGVEAEAKAQAASFRLVSVKPTSLTQTASSDYRFGKTSGPSSMRSRNDGF